MIATLTDVTSHLLRHPFNSSSFVRDRMGKEHHLRALPYPGQQNEKRKKMAAWYLEDSNPNKGRQAAHLTLVDQLDKNPYPHY